MEVSVASNLTLLLQKKSEINKLNLSAYISKILFMLKIKSKSKVNCLLLLGIIAVTGPAFLLVLTHRVGAVQLCEQRCSCRKTPSGSLLSKPSNDLFVSLFKV